MGGKHWQRYGHATDSVCRDAIDTRLRMFPFRRGDTTDDMLPDAPVFGVFEQAMNPLAIGGHHGGNDTRERQTRQHDDDNDASAQGTHDADAGTYGHADDACERDMHSSGRTQSRQYDDAEWSWRTAYQAVASRAMTDMASDDGTGVPDDARHMTAGSVTDVQARDGGHQWNCDMAVPRCEDIIRAISEAYVSHNGMGGAGVRAMDAASGWIGGGMSEAVVFSRSVDVTRMAGSIGLDAVIAIRGLWGMDWGICDMVSSAQRTAVNDDNWVSYVCSHIISQISSIHVFQHRITDVIGMLAKATRTQSVCSVSFPIQYPDRPLLVPLCDGEYDADEWAGRQYWRKVPMHIGDDGRLHDDMWLTRRQERDGDVTPMIAVMNNSELVPQWCAWTEDLHVASVALSMMHDLLIDGSGLLSLSIAESDNGDLMDTLKAIWEWCAAYVWYL